MSSREAIDLNFDRLRAFAPGEPETETASTAVLDPIDLPDVGWPEGLVLAFDQSLANTGYVVVSWDPLLDWSIFEMGVLTTTSIPGKKSWADTLGRAAHLFEMVRDLIAKVGPVLILHEMPPVVNSTRMFRTDASVVTATVIQVAAGSAGIPVEMESAQKVKAYLTGNRNAKKAEVRKALDRRFEVQLNDKSFRRNEHTYDALGIAITNREKPR